MSTPQPTAEARELRRAALRTIVTDLNNSSPECLAAVDELEIMGLQDEVATKTAALEFYANPETYYTGLGATLPILFDSGDKARAALKPTKGAAT